MTKREAYRKQLHLLRNWEPFLLENSGLPGPRGNIELAEAVADEGRPELFEQYRSYDASAAPVGSPREFLAFCGVLGLGRLIAEGRIELLAPMRKHASDPRWRIREAVAMALQRLGDADMPLLIKEMNKWIKGSLLERRAAAAALCEPRLLGNPQYGQAVLHVLDAITTSIPRVQDRRTEDFQALRKGLAYCWSVAVAAFPESGKSVMEKWFTDADKDIRWIMKENLKKKRLERVDPEWVARWKSKLR